MCKKPSRAGNGMRQEDRSREEKNKRGRGDGGECIREGDVP